MLAYRGAGGAARTASKHNKNNDDNDDDNITRKKMIRDGSKIIMTRDSGHKQRRGGCVSRLGLRWFMMVVVMVVTVVVLVISSGALLPILLLPSWMPTLQPQPAVMVTEIKSSTSGAFSGTSSSLNEALLQFKRQSFSQDDNNNNNNNNNKRNSTTLSNKKNVQLEQTQERQQRAMVVYTVARPDQSGAQIQDMMHAHAHAWAQNWTYGGACKYDPNKNNGEPVQAKSLETTQKLLNDLGLSKLFPFACPSPKEEDGDSDSFRFWTDFDEYRKDDTADFTESWRHYVRQHMLSTVGDKNNNNNNHTSLRRRVVVHIRRGDIVPCNTPNPGRYMTNSHYKRVLQHYVLKPFFQEQQNSKSIKRRLEIIIHSQAESYEPWNASYFVDGVGVAGNVNVNDNNHDESLISVQLKLDAPLKETWLDMMTADMLLTSRSSFSIVPAILNFDGQIIYTAFWHKPLKHWTIVSDKIMKLAWRDVGQLAHECKKNYISQQPPKHKRT